MKSICLKIQQEMLGFINQPNLHASQTFLGSVTYELNAVFRGADEI